MRSRRARGLGHKPLVDPRPAARRRWRSSARSAVYYANKDRGVPVVALIVGGFLVFWTFVATARASAGTSTRSAATPRRRGGPGINVDRIRIAVFMISGFMAGVGGIILASRLRSVDTGTGGGQLLLNAIAAAVIGGTSLFGGHGRVVSALLGAAVITWSATGWTCSTSPRASSS